jgi:hypothetical protein
MKQFVLTRFGEIADKPDWQIQDSFISPPLEKKNGGF